MSLTKVNTLGLVYTIEGTDAALKPIMFTAHQDVVPVPEPAAWKYPPFAGHYDGEWLWGRGAVDDKDSLTGVLSCMEALLQNASWTPRRGIVLAFGFDEETGGMRGAGPIATYLEERFGRDSMVLLIDEGGSGMEVVGGDTLYALPGITEKGHADMQYELHMRGGHSSMPLPHTGIGIAAAIITTLEANPFAPTLIPNSPLHHHFVCRARYSPDEDPEITKLVRDGDLAALTTLLASTSPALQFLMQTSQAVDVISGVGVAIPAYSPFFGFPSNSQGLKINAMPEKVNIGVNYRVAPHNSLDELKERTIKLLEPILEQYKITLHAFGKAPIKYGTDARDARNGVHAAYDVDYNATLILTADQPTPPAPLTPTTGAVWDLFSGTIQDTFAIEGGRVVPVGDIMNGNTDTRHYLNLTANVIRFSPMRWEWIANFHAIDEGLHMEGHMEALRFYYNMIRNFDAADI